MVISLSWPDTSWADVLVARFGGLFLNVNLPEYIATCGYRTVHSAHFPHPKVQPAAGGLTADGCTRIVTVVWVSVALRKHWQTGGCTIV